VWFGFSGHYDSRARLWEIQSYIRGDEGELGGEGVRVKKREKPDQVSQSIKRRIQIDRQLTFCGNNYAFACNRCSRKNKFGCAHRGIYYCTNTTLLAKIVLELSKWDE